MRCHAVSRTLLVVCSTLTLLPACSDERIADPTASPANVSGSLSLGLTNAATSDTMTVGDTLQLTANLRNNRKRPRPTVWSSSAPNVASVSSSGLVTALTAGSAMVKASNQYATDSARIIVRSTSVVAASVAVKPDSVAVAVGDTTRLTSTVRDAADAIITGRAVSWSTSDTSIAVVSSAGLVTARRIGLAIVMASCDGVSTTAKVLVTAAIVPTASISITPTTGTVNTGQTLQLSATASDANGNVLSGRTFAWASSNPQVGTVSASGLVTGVAPGTVSVTATTDGKSQTAQVTVQAPVTGTTIYPGADIQAAINANPSGTTFILKAGVHRLTRFVTPKAGNSFLGESGTILNGSRLLTSFVREGAYWVATGQTQENTNRPGECDPIHPRCTYPEDLFFDDKPLVHAGSLAAVTTGKFFFDYPNDKIYFLDDPTGHKVEASVATAAIYASGGQHNVTIAGIVFEKFATQAQGMVVGGGGINDWVIRDNEVRLSHGVGIGLASSQRGKILRNYVHHMGEMGLMGPYATDLLVEGNEIAYNNTAGYWWSWEGGGTKFTHTRGLIVRGNFSHHNEGIGLWTDYDNDGVIYESNRVEDNADNGIFHEISYSAVIRNNTIRRNGFRSPARSSFLGGAGIYVASGVNVEIYGNVLEGNAHGIGAEERPSAPSGPLGQLMLINLNVHDNTVTMAAGSSGYNGVRDRTGTGVAYTAARNNRFSTNHYTLSGLTRPFFWQEGSRTTTDWKAAGQDLTGTFTP